jgi:hypothetical protein
MSRRHREETPDVRRRDPRTLAIGMTDEERYLFDLQGYLVLRDVLAPDHLSRLNAEMDRIEAMDHAYLISRWGGGFTQFHLGDTPIAPACQFRCHNGQFMDPSSTSADGDGARSMLPTACAL